MKTVQKARHLDRQAPRGDGERFMKQEKLFIRISRFSASRRTRDSGIQPLSNFRFIQVFSIYLVLLFS